MSTIYFVFSDESGNYKRNPSEEFLRGNPYYIRSAYIITANEWFKLRKDMLKLKRKFGFNRENEIKWNEIWMRKKKGEDVNTLVDFIEKSLNILRDVYYCKVIFTVTFNRDCNKINEKNLKKMHIRALMQRVQMEIQNSKKNLAIFFLDPPSSHKELKEFQEIYKEIFLNDGFIKEYRNLKDAINFEPSHHSVGIQLADYLAGCFNGFLRGYPKSSDLFKKLIYPLVRKNTQGDPLGYGIIVIPKNCNIRSELHKKLGIMN